MNAHLPRRSFPYHGIFRERMIEGDDLRRSGGTRLFRCRSAFRLGTEGPRVNRRVALSLQLPCGSAGSMAPCPYMLVERWRASRLSVRSSDESWAVSHATASNARLCDATATKKCVSLE